MSLSLILTYTSLYTLFLSNISEQFFILFCLFFTLSLMFLKAWIARRLEDYSNESKSILSNLFHIFNGQIKILNWNRVIVKIVISFFALFSIFNNTFLPNDWNAKKFSRKQFCNLRMKIMFDWPVGWKSGSENKAGHHFWKDSLLRQFFYEKCKKWSAIHKPRKNI